MNQLTLMEQMNSWTGNVHLTASEGYQYYCLPLIGLILLATAIGERPRPAAIR